MAVLALAVAAGPGRADTPQSQPADKADKADHLAPKDAEKRDLAVATRKMSPREMTDSVNELRGKMNDSLKRVVQLQQIAHREKDVLKLNCVNDKLLQLKQLLNIADGAATNLQEAIARNDEDARYAEYGRVIIAQQQVSALSTEAETCIGGDMVFIGPTQVTVDAPLTPDDPTAENGPSFPVVEPLPVASPRM